MEIGRIKGRVYTSRGKIPVKDATFCIRISGKWDEILALAVTDSSGMTGEILIQTPEIDISKHPSSKVPYTLVEVVVEHPEFVSVVLENVQVFPEIETILPVELEPLGEYESSLVEEREISLSTQDL